EHRGVSRARHLIPQARNVEGGRSRGLLLMCALCRAAECCSGVEEKGVCFSPALSARYGGRLSPIGEKSVGIPGHRSGPNGPTPGGPGGGPTAVRPHPATIPGVPAVPRVVLYSRRGCHLCDEARDALQAAAKKWRFDLHEVLIDDDEEL